MQNEKRLPLALFKESKQKIIWNGAVRPDNFVSLNKMGL